MRTSHLLKVALILSATGLHISLSQPTENTTVFPYIPPLTHTPGLGVSMIGAHGSPPHMAIKLFDNITPFQQRQLNTHYQLQEQLLTKGYFQRMQMQNQLHQLLQQLPPNTVEQSIAHRFHNEQRIGELNVWETLVNLKK